MREEATTGVRCHAELDIIVALRDERGSYNHSRTALLGRVIVALRDERGSYNKSFRFKYRYAIVALRDERGSYNIKGSKHNPKIIVALRDERGSYNPLLHLLQPHKKTQRSQQRHEHLMLKAV